MNIIFFATSNFAIPSLRAIARSRHKILSVITRPDTKAGRGLQVLPSPVKIEAGHLGLETYQPQDLLSEDFIKELKQKNADLYVVISYGKILPKEVLKLPKRYCINLHASLLPKYRGAAPCNWAIINGEQKTGVTVIRLNEQMDTGDIITSQSITISEDDASFDIYNELSLIGAETLLATVNLIESKKEAFITQDEKEATYAPRLKKQDGLIDWSNEAEKINNLIRGTQLWPGAYTFLDGKLLKIFKVKKLERLPNDFLPGTIIKIDKDTFTVSCSKGALKIQDLQLEGKNRMSAEEFLRGAKLKEGQSVG